MAGVSIDNHGGLSTAAEVGVTQRYSATDRYGFGLVPKGGCPTSPRDPRQLLLPLYDIKNCQLCDLQLQTRVFPQRVIGIRVEEIAAHVNLMAAAQQRPNDRLAWGSARAAPLERPLGRDGRQNRPWSRAVKA